ncbi:MAG: hypothetical protein JNK48_16975 [Bryobacterales bacterium]|nr:hypothetical protein [Bryobacterales bacterium]
MHRIALLFAASLAFGETVHFRIANEPKEGAFTFLIPSGWRISGGILRINPMTGGGPLNSIAAKLDMQIASADGRTVLRWFPEMNYVDMRGQPAAAMFRLGSNYNGAVVWPKLNAAGYLEQAILAQQRRGAENVRVVATYPLPKAADSYRQVVRQMRVPIDFQFDAALLLAGYSEGGAQWEEALYTAIQDWGPAAAGLWTNKDTFSVRTSAGSLEKLGTVVSVILHSVRLNPKWVEGEIRGQIQRNEIAIRTQEEVTRLDREIVEHRRRTNAEINNQMYHNLMGTEEYVNPLSKRVEVGSNAWSHRWVNERGEAIYSDDTNFDPKRLGLEGFVRSPVRRRFPDK